jgi:hypothetical protein
MGMERISSFCWTLNPRARIDESAGHGVDLVGLGPLVMRILQHNKLKGAKRKQKESLLGPKPTRLIEHGLDPWTFSVLD